MTVVSYFKKRNGNSAAQFYSDQEWSTRLQARHVDHYLTCSMLAKLLQIVAKKAEMVNPTKNIDVYMYIIYNIFEWAGDM